MPRINALTWPIYAGEPNFNGTTEWTLGGIKATQWYVVREMVEDLWKTLRSYYSQLFGVSQSLVERWVNILLAHQSFHATAT